MFLLLEGSLFSPGSSFLIHKMGVHSLMAPHKLWVFMLVARLVVSGHIAVLLSPVSFAWVLGLAAGH